MEVIEMRPIEKLFPEHQSKTDAGICTTCGKEAKAFKDSASENEHKISGMCQECQDCVFDGVEP